MEKEYKMSQARKDELEQELNYLKTWEQHTLWAGLL